jgi:pilus assembly protein Flp/PilA
MIKKLMNFFKDEEGATAVEYGIMVAAIAALIITVVMMVGQETNRAFETIRSNMAELPTAS